ncbi:shikimate dehydrogenase [Pseudomonas sp. LRF_L74]|uniref:shikimate dehydrogenase n=1 Tax=Pseudomonas sp. LRF_L74 TaxID=3369422 RepID=UPI003F605103
MSDQYAVIGNPIGHSKSPYVHTAFARQTGQRMSYIAIEGALDGFAGEVARFFSAGGRGLNVTVPFKVQALALAERSTERARLAGAANTLRWIDGRLEADNTDGVGLVNDIQDNLGLPLGGRRVLLLGAGGAGRGILRPLIEQSPSLVMVVDIDRQQAATIVQPHLHLLDLRCSDYASVGEMEFDVVINATSASLQGVAPPIQASILQGAALAYDLVYGKGLTPFLRLARDAGVDVLADGVGMLVEQAAASFQWWRGIRPQTLPLIDALRVPLT